MNDTFEIFIIPTIDELRHDNYFNIYFWNLQ